MEFSVPAAWPEGRPLAICVNVMCELWSDDSAPGLGPMGNPLKPGYIDTASRAWAEYGLTTGTYRLLDIAENLGVRCGSYVNGLVTERWPNVVRRLAEGGHEIIAHGWTQDRYPVYMTREEEAAEIKQCLDAFEKCVGIRPTGYGGTRGTASQHTAELLAASGFHWMVDYMNADVPYLKDTPAGAIAVVPFTMDVNDLPMHVRYGNQPRVFTETLRDIIEGYPSIGNPHAVLDINVHSHVFGRLGGAIQFRRCLEMVKDLPWVWMTTREDLSALVRSRT